MEPDPRSHIRRDHRPAAVAARLAAPRRSRVSDWVLGAIDGGVTTFAIAAGAIGASLSSGVVVVLGLANLLADGFSMAAGRYAGARAETDRRASARRRERQHVSLVPEGEREEVRQILANKGIGGADLERAVKVITADEERWIDFMLVEELGFSPHPERPAAAATATFLVFLACCLLPIAPFLVDEAVGLASPMLWSGGVTAVAFATIGAVKGQVTGQPPLKSALWTLAVGGGAAAIAFAIGLALRGVV